jgi:anti-sigma factor RsiW
MTCGTFDVKGYLLGELTDAERQHLEAHVTGCPNCREEFERLRVTHAALTSVNAQEIPRRIAFVSDKVFEPRWWQVLWSSGPRWVFASAALLAAAIVVHAFIERPVTVAPAQPDLASIRAIVEKEVAQGVAEAVSSLNARHKQETARMLAAAEQQFELKRQEDRLFFAQNLEVLNKRLNVMHLASAWHDRERQQ